MNLSAKHILQQYWGYSSFRPQQEEIINALIEEKDVLAIMPTGGGKSLCYQVPALMKPGLCLVISPLIALMKDQVSQLNELNIPSLCIHSGMQYTEVKYTLQQATHGECKLLYVSPERLQTKIFKDYLPALDINLIAVDEAHCISQWGYDFRPPYLLIADIKNEIENNVPVIALTASATEKVQFDIIDKLRLKDPLTIKQSFARAHLSYSVLLTENKQNKLVDILQKVNGASIVYCNSRKKTKQIAELLQSHGINADYYHAGLNTEERNKKQDAWMKDECRVIVSTNAFGMGINKANVRVVVHFDTPDCLENYYQESGRAGRDGKTSFAVLLIDHSDTENIERTAAQKFPSVTVIKNIYQSLADHLQIPVGAGENMSYDFDLKAFCNNFNYNVIEVMNVLQILQTQGFLSYNESVMHSSSVQFISDHEHLESFGKLYPKEDEWIKILLRTYAGIFDDAVNIYEKQLAKIAKQPEHIVIETLHRLHQYRIIRYTPKKETPQIILLTDRAPAAYLNINEKQYNDRKADQLVRTEKLIRYIKLSDSCRSKYIAAYFGDMNVEDCGNCDNCLKQKQRISSDEFKQLTQRIQQQLSAESTSINDLITKLNITQTKAKTIIDHLIAEEILFLNDQNLLQLKK